MLSSNSKHLLKLVASLLLGLYMQHDWVESLYSQIELRNQIIQSSRKEISNIARIVGCSPQYFPHFSSFSIAELVKKLLEEFSDMQSLKMKVQSMSGNKLSLDQNQIMHVPQDSIEYLNERIRAKFGATYLETVSRNEELLQSIYYREYGREIERIITTYRLEADPDEAFSLRTKGFVVAFTLSLFLLVLGRQSTLFFYYFLVEGKDAKTFEDMRQAAALAWVKATSSDD